MGNIVTNTSLKENNINFEEKVGSKNTVKPEKNTLSLKGGPNKMLNLNKKTQVERQAKNYSGTENTVKSQQPENAAKVLQPEIVLDKENTQDKILKGVSKISKEKGSLRF